MKTSLLADFPPVATTEWEQAIQKFLKGKSLTSLDWAVSDGLYQSALYRKEQVEHLLAPLPLGDTPPTAWEIVEKVTYAEGEATVANQTILEALQGGASEIWVHIPDQQTLQIADWATLWAGVGLEMIRVGISTDLTENIQTYADFLTQQNIPKQATQGHFELRAADMSKICSFCLKYTAIFENYSYYGIDLAHFGTDPVAQLAKALNLCYEWQQLTEKAGFSGAAFSRQLLIQFPISNIYLLELSKIRAWRKLWAAFWQGLGHTEFADARIYAYNIPNLVQAPQTAHFNLITATAQALSAVIAGVDSLFLAPYSSEPAQQTQAKRLARNIQHLLAQESSLHLVTDTAAGAFYIEQLTQQLTEQAWAVFLEP
jgi:methylmalonyl-CoA mutase